MMTSRSSPWMFSRFLTSRPTNWPSCFAFPFGFEPVAELVVVAGQALQRLLDLALLGLGKRDDADAQAAVSGDSSPADELGDVVGLGGVAALLIDAVLQEVKADAAVRAARRRWRRLRRRPGPTMIGRRSAGGRRTSGTVSSRP